MNLKRLLVSLLLSSSLLCSGCSGGGEGPATSRSFDNSPTLDQLKNSLMIEMQNNVPENDRILFEQITNFVDSYFSKQAALRAANVAIDDKATKEEMYRRFALMAFFQRSMKGSLWAALKSIESNGDYAPSLHHAGIVLNQLKRHREAIVFLERAKELDDTSAHTRISLAVAYNALGRKDDAIAEAQKAVEFAPEDDIISAEASKIISNVELFTEKANYEQQCLEDMKAGINIRNSTEYSNFISRQNNEITDLTNNIMSSMEYIIAIGTNETLAMNFSSLSDEHGLKTEKIINDANSLIEIENEKLLQKEEQLRNQNLDCLIPCIESGPDCVISCNKIYFNGQVLNGNNALNKITPIIKEMSESLFFETQRHEFATQYLIATLNYPRETDWVWNSLYTNLMIDCKNAAINSASALATAYFYIDIAAQTLTNLNQSVSESDRQALEEELNRKLLEEYEKRIGEMEMRLADLHQTKTPTNTSNDSSLPLDFSLCPSDLFCVSLKGTQFSYSANSTLINAAFTADIDKMEVGVSVSTGVRGFSVGLVGTVNSSGTSFKGVASYSGSLGPVSAGKDIVLFNRSFIF